MFTGFERIVEERIRRAQREGVFEDLPGAGVPLRLDDANVPEDLRLTYKILKNADCLPREIELKKEIQSTRELLSGMTETAEKYKTLKKLNLLIFKLNAMCNTSAALDIPECYLGALAKRFETD